MNIMMDPGTTEAIKWLMVVFLISFTMRPYLCMKNLKTFDYGFGLSYGLGLALSFLAAWFVSACGLCEFNTWIMYGSLIIFSIAPIVYGKITHTGYSYWNKERLIEYLIGFLIFNIIFWTAFWIIGFNPLIDETTENYMDYGFLKSIYQWKQVPPKDIWLAGSKLQYYYLGQAAVAFMCRLSFTTPEYGYNIMLCTILASTALMTGEIAFSLIDYFAKEMGNVKEIIKKKAAIAAALVASLTACFSSNGYYFVYGVFKPLFSDLSGPSEQFYFSSPLSYISVAHGDPDNGRTEFPIYTIILGDLHAHVINMVFVLPLIALLLDFACEKEQKEKYKKVVLFGVLLALYKGTNYWDFAIYTVVTGAILVFCGLEKKIGILINIAIVFVISMLLALPFTLQFKKIASQICLAENHSPFGKLMVWWGFFLLLSIYLIYWLFKSKKKDISITKDSMRFGLLAMILCTIGLLITPELVYVKDIYGIDYARFNIMFKMTFEAYLFFGIFVGIVMGIWILNLDKKKRYKLFALALALYTLVGFSYTPQSVNDWMGNVYFDNVNNRKGISAVEALSNKPEYSFEKKVSDYIEADSKEHSNIIEAAGDSYSHANVVSVLTGNSTIIGWKAHEWLWQNDGDLKSEKAEIVRRFYEEGNRDYCLDVINEYDIKYIILGNKEYNTYAVNDAGFAQYGNVVFYEEADGKNLKLIKINDAIE